MIWENAHLNLTAAVDGTFYGSPFCFPVSLLSGGFLSTFKDTFLKHHAHSYYNFSI